ncbi:MAG TPA: 16S rRNA (cytosine(967)-C(5))-methyltransferase RsmB [Gammaproteobacteria bacterium]|nr:16S rRNA (cytosine(967)-C(5))-methyltransferase RsmB [Gammaproteobacteria bacterium]
MSASRSNPRLQAARAVEAVLKGKSLSDSLPGLTGTLEPADRGLAAELAYGSLRFAPRLAWQLNRLLKRPLDKREPLIHALLLVGLYQLAYTRVAEHAAVSETVNAVKPANKEWARGLVNAILRRFGREQAALNQAADKVDEARFAHPRWLIEAIQQDWPQQADQLFIANNARAPMTLRVNTRHGSVADYAERLHEAGLSTQTHPYAPSALVLDEPTAVTNLPGFTAGDVSVQDAAAQLAAPLLDLQPGLQVLDACAAPGGKTAHSLELQPELAGLVALDKDETRLDQVAENLARLALSATLITADAGDTKALWLKENGQEKNGNPPFDRILLDAPCSATGVIRRHPDIKALRRKTDIPALVSQQARLLDALWLQLKPGGKLLYATCSVLNAENAHQIKTFLARTPNATAPPIAADWGQPAGMGRQILPGEAGMDGFFYAQLVKTQAG